MRQRTFIACLWAMLIGILAVAPAGAQQFQPLATCSIEQVQQAFGSLSPYSPTNAVNWVRVEGDHFVEGSAIYYPQGVNYYPQRSPWRRFLTETNLDEVEREMGLLSDAGLNTIRVYLWNEALFSCPGSGAVPIPATFQRLDGIVQSASRHGIHVIMTLNDMPDLQTYPLYSNPTHTQSQTAFIVSRYRDEPAVMAWDMRNAGDIDYGSENNWQGAFSKEAVLGWLGQTQALIRSVDTNHLITAGWGKDSEATVPYVDFVSFAYWNPDMNGLRDRLTSLRSATSEPLVLSSFGYSTFEHSEEEQAQLIGSTIQVAEEFDAAGWLLWTAFDFPLDVTCVPPACPSQDNREHHFGLWRWDLSAKPAVQSVSVG
jgi:endo-1,4-beta-mannosidase